MAFWKEHFMASTSCVDLLCLYLKQASFYWRRSSTKWLMKCINGSNKVNGKMQCKLSNAVLLQETANILLSQNISVCQKNVPPKQQLFMSYKQTLVFAL